MQPIGMEMQAEVEMEQSAAAGSGAFAEEYAAAAESRKYWFDRKEILRTKRLYWMGRRAARRFLFFAGPDRAGCSHGHCGTGDLDRQPRRQSHLLPGPRGGGMERYSSFTNSAP